MKDNGRLTKALLKIIAMIAEDKAEDNKVGWPPICAGILHQPERPMAGENEPIQGDS